MLKSVVFAAMLIASAAAACTPRAASGAEEPLIVGAVRDQHGFPVVDARVVLLDAAGRVVAEARTDALGTFAVAIPPDRSAAVRARLSCAFCRTAAIAVPRDRTVVAVIERYAALAFDAPSARDLAVLPYADVEDALALRPFTVVPRRTPLARTVVPVISDRGLGGGAGLVLDASVPAYDLAFGGSGLADVPAGYLRGVDELRPIAAPRYGDAAGGGTFDLRPFDGAEGSDVEAAFGGRTSLRFAGDAPSGDGIAAGLSDAAGELRRRADVRSSVGAADARFDGRAAVATAHAQSGAGSADRRSALVGGAYSAALPRYVLSVDAFGTSGAADLRADDAASNGRWSDLGLRAVAAPRAESTGRAISSLIGVGLLSATASYRDAVTAPSYAARAAQASLFAEERARSGVVTTTLDLAGFGVSYRVRSGTAGDHLASTSLLTPALSVEAPLGPSLAVRADLVSSFRLLPLAERYGPSYTDAPASVPPTEPAIVRYGLSGISLDATDARRVRATLSLYREVNSDAHAGPLAGAGVAAVWQAAPALAVHAWLLRLHGAATAPSDLYASSGYALPGTAGVAWLTYEPRVGRRVDAVLRRSVDATGVHTALDADVSLPAGRSVAAFAFTEQPDVGGRLYGVGLRLNRR